MMPSVIQQMRVYIWPKEKKVRLLVIGTMLSLLAGKLLSVATPFLYKKSVDLLNIPTSPVTMFIFIIFAYGAARIFSQGFNDLRDVLFAKVLYRATHIIALEVFAHLHKLSLSFHLNRKTGSLSRDIDRGIKAIETLLMFMIFNIVPTFFEVLLALGLLLYFYPLYFSLIIFGTIGCYVFYTIWITLKRLKVLRAKNEAESDASGKGIDSLLNYETVKYFSKEQHELHRYDSKLSVFIKYNISLRQSLGLLNFGQGVIIAVGLMGLMYLAGLHIREGTMSLGDYVLLNTFLLQLYTPLFFLGFAYREMREAFINLERMLELKNTPIDVKDKDNARALNVTNGDVSFNNISFYYNEERPILKNVSFHIPAGETVALVGASGSGKSTMARLLFRFYDPQEGDIRIDGQDISQVSTPSLRQHIAVVAQDAVLFNDTLGYNIGYALDHYDEKLVKEAAKRAHLDELLKKLPQGLETLVGERGLKLSGGEKQRVCIARALLKKPKLFIFDEATSALDTHTEKAIQKDLESVSKGVTTLLIAHRLSTVVNAHNIIVLHEGEIVEQGTHEQLLKINGRYAALWQQQLKQQVG